jgi:glutamine amidotransferase
MTSGLSPAADPRSAQVCILDYGSGNVQSVRNLVSTITSTVSISNDSHAIESASHLILPGVGAFGASMERIRARLPLGVITSAVLERGKPFLGICVGMQMLAERGLEFGSFEGLGWLPGEVRRLAAGDLLLPHVGWNTAEPVRTSPLTAGLGEEADFYFLHSYIYNAPRDEDVVARTEYGERFCSIVERGNIFGVQFHPEKSQKAGEVLIRNFLSLGAR